MYELLLLLAGAAIAIYIAAQWLIYFVQINSWLALSLALLVLVLFSVGLWLKVRVCGYILAAVASVVCVFALSGNISVLFPY
ncbi:hypothetical protein [Methylomonas albis]|uniref:Uncharacterized protein n=1 Tax=Methylomonas albis TaxID=1854563 RepID=A0ABR9D8U2_9GAMM|nr:hypothetical protein [Methylomonas albis]MBD9358342.1 hypothetical protein [Methylomonas albis]CAD6881733.1 hypothetical protein [Methylomonas albis]